MRWPLNRALTFCDSPLITHCTFNPIELIWAWVKRKVARRNKTFRIGYVKKLTEEALGKVTAEQCRSACQHCDKICDAAWMADGIQYEVNEDIIIHIIQDSNSDEGDSESDSNE